MSQVRGLELATLTDVGTEREHNEDHCGSLREGESAALVVVADGVSGSRGGETASRIAVEAVLREYRAQPAPLGAARRLARAAQRANIEVHELALTVPELAGMATTLTAVAVEGAELSAAHVGDSRLYLLREGAITQLSKDHTAAAEQVRLGLLGEKRARTHPGRSVLTRSLGRELIVGIDRISLRLHRDDRLLLCSDGLYNVLDDREIAALAGAVPPDEACRALVEAANARGTSDNLTAAVLRVAEGLPAEGPPPSLGERLRRLAGGLLPRARAPGRG